MRRLCPVLLLALAVVPAAQAPAQTPPPAAPAKAEIALDLQKVGFVDRAVAFTGKAFRVRGTVTPFVAGQRVRIRLYRGKNLLVEKTKAVRPSESGDVGLFVADLRSRFSGRMRVGVTHVATDAMGYSHRRSPAVSVIGRSISSGQSGHSVKVVQRLLRDKGYVVGRFGMFDARTARAVHAFRKMTSMARTYDANMPMLRRLVDGGGRFAVRYPNKGRHVEADLTHQVLALIDGRKVLRLYPTSSGTAATPTVLGSWRVYRKDLGTNSLGMVHSSYFIRGYAIHGFASVPSYPASHGCLRVPVPDAYSIFRWVQMSDWVSTYYRDSKPRTVKVRADAGP